MKNSEVYFVVFLVAAVLLFNSCCGPIEGDDIIFVTQNTYKDLPPDADQIILKTEKYNLSRPPKVRQKTFEGYFYVKRKEEAHD